MITPEQIGIITPYRGQRNIIRDKLGQRKGIDVEIVDGFQGRECDIIIYSIVGTSPGSLGFAGDRNRFNVATTRLKTNLIVMGNANRIKEKTPHNNILRSFAENVSDRNRFYNWSTKSWTSFENTSPPESPMDDHELESSETSTESPSEIPSKALKRLQEIVELQPTSNVELAERWGYSEGKEVHKYLSQNLDEYFYRDTSVKIRATKVAEKLVRGTLQS